MDAVWEHRTLEAWDCSHTLMQSSPGSWLELLFAPRALVRGPRRRLSDGASHSRPSPPARVTPRVTPPACASRVVGLRTRAWIRRKHREVHKTLQKGNHRGIFYPDGVRARTAMDCVLSRPIWNKKANHVFVFVFVFACCLFDFVFVFFSFPFVIVLVLTPLCT